MIQNEYIEELAKINIKLDIFQKEKFETYKELLKQYNKRFNLTAITEDKDIYLKHFYDSLYIIKEMNLNNKNIIDIGVGAGFPSIPLAILLNNSTFTLVESNTKKCKFLSVIKKELQLNNVIIENIRAEEYVKNNREKFDVALSRAVAHLSIIIELEIPALKINGQLLALKSNYLEELKESNDIIKKCNAKIDRIINYTLPCENSKRSLILINKINTTNINYPRNYSKMIKDLKKVKK